MVNEVPKKIINKVLIAPAHYLFSDKYGSEPLWSYEIVCSLANHVGFIDVIVGVNDLSDFAKQKIPQNVKIIPIYKSRSQNPLIELFKRVGFYFFVFLTYWYKSSEKNYDVVHHLFPLSLATYNPVIAHSAKQKNRTTVLGPIQLPQVVDTEQDLSVVLTGSGKKSFSSILVAQIYKILFFLVKPFAKKMFKSADVVLCNSNASKSYYSDKIKAKELKVIESGINFDSKVLQLVKNSTQIRVKNEIPVILCVGQLSKRKGQKYLLEALLHLKNEGVKFKAVLVGRDNLNGLLQKLVVENNLQDFVEFIPNVPHDQIWEYYAKANIFCLPSLSDPSPTVLLEAMLFELPVVATNVGSVKEIVGDAGLVVESKNSQMLHIELKKLIESNDLRLKLGNKGSTKVFETYNWDKITQKYVNLYKINLKNV